MTDHIQKSLLVFILGLVFPTCAYACVLPTSVQESIKKHNVIFSGTVDGCFSDKDGSDESYVRFSLDRMWKGKGERTLLFPYKCSPMHRDFKEETYYLVYANYAENSKYINISYGAANCTRTTVLSQTLN